MRRIILLLLLPLFGYSQTRQSGAISFTPQWNYKISGSDTTWQFGNTLMSPQQFPYILTKWQSDQRYATAAGYVPITRLVSTNAGTGTTGGGNLGSNLTIINDTSGVVVTKSYAARWLTQASAAGLYQPLNAKLTSISALANASGVLTNDGSGVLSYTTPSTGTITSVTPGYGFTSSTPITASGTMTIDTATKIVDKAFFNGKIGTTVATALAGKQASLGFTPENVANKATTYGTVNNTLYPTIQLMRDSTLHPNKNLSDITNKPTALANLGAAPIVQYTVYADNYTDTFTGWNADGFNHGSAIFQAYSAYPGKAIKIVLSNKTYVPVCQLVSKKLTRDNVTIVGAGMAQRADNAKSMTANTGTIIQGTLYPWANNFTISDLSIDAGITVSQSYYSSTLALDGFVMSKYPYVAGGNDTTKTNLVARNINILLPDPNSQSHAFLVEEYTKAFIDNISTTYGFHGFVIKAKNIQVGNIKSYGSVGEGFYIKSDDDNRQSVNNQINNIIVDRVPTGHPYRITTRDSSQNAVFIAGIISFANKNQISSINAKGYTYGVQIQANDTTDISNLHINSIIADSCKNGVIYYGRNINQVTIDAVNVINAKDNVIQAYLTGATTASNAISIGNLTVTGSTDRANLINIAGRGGIQIDYVESANAALQDVFTIGANGYLKISDYNIGTNYINLYGTGSLAVTGLRADITTINSTSLPLKYDKTGGNINAGTGLQTNVNINSNVTAQLQLNSTYPSTGKSWYATSYLDGNLYIAQPGIGNVITGNGTTGHVDFMNTVTGLDPVNAQDFVTKGYQSTQLALKANLATTPQIVAHGDLTAQTATGTICTYTVGATNESLTLQMSHNVTTTLVGATNYQVTFTDINNVAVTYKASIAMGTVVGYMGVAAGTGSNNNVFVNPLIRAKAGTTVTLMTTGTLTSGVMDISGSITKLY